MAADPSVKAKEPIGPEQAEEAAITPLVVWAARLSIYFLAQGGILLLSYAYFGFKTDPNSLPLGFRLDPIHATVHFVWGLVGTCIGFFQPRYATAFVLSFAVLYTFMAVGGTFTPCRFGMVLDYRVNLFQWFLVPPVWAIGLYGLWRERHPERAPCQDRARSAAKRTGAPRAESFLWRRTTMPPAPAKKE